MRLKLYAYFAGNLGDDLMVRLLLERYPKIQFFTDTWAVESDVFREYPNFENMEKLIARHGRLNHLLNLLTLYRRKDFYLNWVKNRRKKDCRAAVYIGGSVYTGRTEPEAEEGKLKSGPLFIIGANYTREAADFRAYFRRCAGVTFRDRASYRRFQELPNVGYAPDVVLSFRPEPKPPKAQVLISVMDLTRRPETAPWAADYEDFLVRICRECERPVLVSFCQREGDEAALERIAARAGNAQQLRYRGNPDRVLEAFASAEAVIATRLHAMILGFCHQKKVFAISYDEKVRNAAKDMEFSGICPISELKELDAKEALSRCALPENLEKYQLAAQAQFARLDAFLEDCHGNR